jgi:hypothetical protein
MLSSSRPLKLGTWQVAPEPGYARALPPALEHVFGPWGHLTDLPWSLVRTNARGSSCQPTAMLPQHWEISTPVIDAARPGIGLMEFTSDVAGCI